MTFIQLRNGQFVLQNGRLATGETCCCRCPLCETGSLPDFITVALDNFPNTNDDSDTTCCGDFYNGKSYVLQRIACTFRHDFCGVGSPGKGFVEVEYRGDELPPTVVLRSGQGSTMCDTDFETETLLACSDPFEFTAEAANGATAVVSPGGQYDPNDGYAGECSCHICCQGSAAVPEEIEATLYLPRTGELVPGSDGNYDCTQAPAELEIGVTLLRTSCLKWEIEAPNYYQPLNVNYGDNELPGAVEPQDGWNCYYGQQFGGGYGWPWRITVEQIPCDTQTATHWTGVDPDLVTGTEYPDVSEDDCGFCSNKCITRVTINPEWDNTDNPTHICLPLSCADCQDTPTCQPKSGEYSYTNSGVTYARLVIT